MNFFEQELRKIVEPVCPDATFVGRFCFVPLGANNRAKINFVTSGVADNYDTLQIKIVNKNDGELDCVRLRLSDLLGAVQSGNLYVQQSGPYIWQYGSKIEWYGYKPTEKNLAVLTEAVKSYVELFQEQTMEQSVMMQQGMTM